MASVKICGNTRVRDVEVVAELGAEFIGVVVDVPVPTPRKVSVEKAKEILHVASLSARSVAVIMPNTLDAAVGYYRKLRPDFLQLHGEEDVTFLKNLRGLVSCGIIKTIHVKGKESVQEAKKCSRFVDAILLDTPSEKMGGSGKIHDWNISKKIVKEIEKPVILAGGLNPENVKKAVEMVNPYAVDVSSGVETHGRKDYKKVKKFIQEASI
jgi:phosphoribosylanthranilate isomerase